MRHARGLSCTLGMAHAPAKSQAKWVAMATAKKAAKKKGATKRKRKGVSIQATTLAAAELPILELPSELEQLAEHVTSDGGAVIGAYKEPLGGQSLMLVSIPIDKVAPTSFQRDVSAAHVGKLVRAMDKTRRFLDPLILVRKDGAYLTPNGNHRLTALRELNAKAIVGLLVPEIRVAYQILALNIEKAHNLRERALEVVRIVHDLADEDRSEQDMELELEEPALITLGFAYEQRGRLAGGAYNPVLRKVDSWIKGPFSASIPERERRAEVLLGLDDAVNDAVAKLKEAGLTSPYLKTFVVSRINPLRFIKGDLPSFDELLTGMTKRARGMKTDKIKPSDLARSGGAPDDDE
jgi:ParB family transcriptional regulator, chromosome partitioning protein